MKFEISLSGSDVEAILCALPLVTELDTSTPHQAAVNAALCASASKKLSSGAIHLTPNEIRVVSVALNAAVLLLSGQCPEFFDGIDKEWKSILSPYFFSLNKLDGAFQRILEQSGFLPE